jgi:WD40 repeat protein
MSETLYDVFLSHSSKDKPIVRALAERLRADGLRVWFDEWYLKPGDSVPAKLNEGLKYSHVLILCMSANAFGSEWAQLESQTFLYRDPLNKERRFIPLRLDDAPIEDSLAQFLHLSWKPDDREREYSKLVAACRAPVIDAPSLEDSPSPETRPSLSPPRQQPTDQIFRFGHVASIRSVAFSPDGTKAVSGCDDGILRLLDIESGQDIKKFEGHKGSVWSVAFSPDGRHVGSGGYDNTLRLWDRESRQQLWSGKKHTSCILSLAFSPDGRHLLSGSADHTMWLWDAESGQSVRLIEGNGGYVWSVAFSLDGHHIVSGSHDDKLRLWDVQSGQSVRTFHGHNGQVLSAAFSRDSRYIVSSARDNTLRLWNAEDGQAMRTFEGHTGPVWSATFSPDGRQILSGADDCTVRLWDAEGGQPIRTFLGHDSVIISVGFHPDGNSVYSADANGIVRVWKITDEFSPSVEAQTIDRQPVRREAVVQYANAKVLLVGESGVGKTGLANYLSHRRKDVERNSSTDGAWATQWALPHSQGQGDVDREIWLWDFAGQVDYRLVHQLFMNETAAAVLVFNPQAENPFEGLGHWDADLRKASQRPFAKLLAAGRIDRGGLVVSVASMNKFMTERGFREPLHLTSAKTGAGCDGLRDAIVGAIDWGRIPITTSLELYHRIKEAVLRLRDSGTVLIRLAELNQRLELSLGELRFTPAELQTALGHLAGPGMIQRVEFGGFILLRPEVLSRYAAAVVRKVRKHPQELGCIREDELLAGDLDYQDFQRLPREDEAVVLRALLETFISRAWCLRQPCDHSAMLTFPSYFRRERKEQPGHPDILVTYRFEGPTDEIYATLVVRLHHTLAFDSTELWKSAADFRTQTGAALGFTLTPESEGTSRLEVYFEPNVDENSRVLFLRYVHDHLEQNARNVKRLRHYGCRNKKCQAFGRPFPDQGSIDRALGPGGMGKVFCPGCGMSIPLRDAIEKKFDSPELKRQVRELQAEGQEQIDSVSREMVALNHTGFVVREAGQIYRGYEAGTQGIDGEIEFKDDEGRPSGKRLYVQIRLAGSYEMESSGKDTLEIGRGAHGDEVVRIKNPEWADQWRQKEHPLMLVLRTSDGEIRWMNVSDYFKQEGLDGQKPVDRIEFDGERFDIASVGRWRERLLAGKA